MDIEGILNQLRNQRAQLDRAIEALSGTTMDGRGHGGRGKHRMSAAGRRKLSLMMKRRWAARRKQKVARVTKKPVSRAVTKPAAKQDTA